MVGGFVEDEDVGLLQHDLAEEESGGLTTGEGFGFFHAFFAAEEHLSEDATDVFLGGLGVEGVEPLGDGGAVGDGAGVVLGEVADLGFVAPLDGAGVDGDVGFFDAGAVGEQGFEQGRFALAVAAHEDDLFAAKDGGGEVVDDVFGGAVFLGVGLVDELELEDVLAGGADHVEADEGAGDVGAGELGGGEALDFFFAGVHLRGAGAGGEAGDEVVELGDFLFALLVLRLDAGADGGLLEDHVIVAAGVGDDGFVVDVGGVGADVVEEVAVVRDGDDGAVVAGEEVLEPVDGLEIEVVGGLVEEQGFGVAEEGLGEEDADFLAALELGHFAIVELVGDVEALEEDGGVGLGLVAVFVADDAFELAET